MPIDYTYKALDFLPAISFLRRKLNIPTTRSRDLMGRANEWAFAVAVATKAQLLTDLREAVDKAIADGESLGRFRQRFDSAVQEAGWDYRGGRNWRSKIIYQTNLRTSYQAGRAQQIDAVRDERPYLLYRHGGAVDPRERHVDGPPDGFNGLVLRSDDDFWSTHFPPNGWGCGCSVFTLSERDLERRGLTVDDPPDLGTYEDTDTQTGEVREVPIGIDPGWDYKPGSEQERGRKKEQLRRTIATLPPELRDQARSEVEANIGPLDE